MPIEKTSFSVMCMYATGALRWLGGGKEKGESRPTSWRVRVATLERRCFNASGSSQVEAVAATAGKTAPPLVARRECVRKT